MGLRSLQDLQLDNDGFYDLTERKFYIPQNVILLTHVVQYYEEGRIDNISNELYNTAENYDLLLFINNIVNPYSIKQGQIIYYPDTQDLKRFYYTEESEKNINNILLDKSKVNKKDNNREKYNKDKKSFVPPTLNTNNVDQVVIDGKNVIIGKGSVGS